MVPHDSSAVSWKFYVGDTKRDLWHENKELQTTEETYGTEVEQCPEEYNWLRAFHSRLEIYNG